jgi:hypothetical protein
MTAPRCTQADIEAARFVDDTELRRRLCPTVGWERFVALIRGLEAAGFPRIDKRWGLRDFEKVKRWLDEPCGLSADAGIEEIQDGPECFDAAPLKRARAQDRPHPEGRDAVTLLVRAQRRA